MSEPDWLPEPTCPKCGEADSDWWDGTSLVYDGDEKAGKCPFCGAGIKITMCVTTTFQTVALEGEGDE